MYILGINAFHGDSSACILKNSQLIAAAEEERFRRIKHWAGFPSESIKYCLKEAGIEVSDVTHIAINQDIRAHLGRKIIFALRGSLNLMSLLDRIKNKRARLNILDLFKSISPSQDCKAELIQIEHHMAHLSSAYYVSPFKEAALLSIDGFGDFASVGTGVGMGNIVRLDNHIYFPHSLGTFYQALTQFIGFPNYGDEYKVMGLAPYGRPVYLEQMRKIVILKKDGGFELNLNYFRHHREKIEYEWKGGAPSVGILYDNLIQDLLGTPRAPDEVLTQRHMDIAHSVQLMYEEAFFHILNSLYEKYKIGNLAIAGGCAMNSVANGKITMRTPFENVYVQSAAGDAGGAIGAAYAALAKIKVCADKKEVSTYHDHAYWGPEFSNKEIKKVLEENDLKISSESCTINYFEDINILYQVVASDIGNGAVVGWFQGRMEWGPRALGNRSILCDPRRANIQQILNKKIKKRESFRPFAPSILRTEVSNWFEQDGDVPFMMQVYQIKKNKRLLIPAVTHVDGSGRLQTVTESANPRYHGLITAFNELTGIPILLNTSFNENEPIVCRPEEALNCFLRTRMDILVMGNWLIRRSSDG